MGKYFIKSILRRDHKETLGFFIWWSVEFLTQRIRVLGASLPLYSSLKRVYQPNKSRFYNKFVIFMIIAGLTGISMAQNAGYQRQTQQPVNRNRTSSRSDYSGAVKNPYTAEDYMLKLAEKLSPEQRDLLLKGSGVTRDITKESGSVTAGQRGEGTLFDNLLTATTAEPNEEKWSLKKDLDKYRAYAIKEGSRYPDENLGKFFLNAGLFVEDGINIFTLGYGSDRGKVFRGNDGNSPLWHAKTVAEQGRQTLAEITDGFYSVIDLMTFDSLADIRKDVYRDNNPVVRPFLFTGRAVGSGWKTTENIGNTLTWGYFDNVSGSAAMCVVDVIECIKQGGQAVTNLPREVLYVTTGVNENTDKMLDWLLVVPWELASNAVEMQGIANMCDYKTAFKEKGVVGSILEMTGSSIIIYKSIDELNDDDDDHKHKTTESQQPEIPSGDGDGGGNGGDVGGGGDSYFFEYPFPWDEIPDNVILIW
jgi:hypothetical protein